MNGSRFFSQRWGAVVATGALIGGLVLLNGAAIREIIAARDEARRLARHEIELRLEERGQAYRARLANLRADVRALLESPPLNLVSERLASADPLVRRWARLDVEGTLVLFVQSRPALRELWLSTGDEAAPVKVGRREGAVVVLDPAHAAPRQAADWRASQGSFQLGQDAWARAWVDLGRILGEEGDPGVEGMTLEPAAPAAAGGPGLVAAVEIEDPRWDPPVHVWLVARQEETQVERSVGALAGRYRRTVIWNLVVILALSAVVALALAQMHRRVRAEAAATHERKVRELERGLLHSERLASVGRFAAGVAHEVNNPLEGMGNYLRLLEADLESGDALKARERLRRVREGLERAAAVVRRVLTFSDPARSPKEPVSMVGPVREAVDFLRPRFAEVAIEVVDGTGGAEVLANRVDLSQLFLNLLLNACEGQEGGGGVRIELSADDAWVTARIADQGPGLAAGTAERLFEPFFSTRGSSGLGLAVCHGIVQDHGGEISAANATDGSGAVFEVHLPRAVARRAAQA